MWIIAHKTNVDSYHAKLKCSSRSTDVLNDLYTLLEIAVRGNT